MDISKLLACNQCGTMFGKKSSMIRHMKSHEGKRYRCATCSKSFGRKDDLQRHKTKFHSIHGQVKKKVSSACKYCAKSFARKFCLNRHLTVCEASIKNSHTDQKIRKRLKHYSDLYREEIEIGQTIAKFLWNHSDIPEESLSPEYKRVLYMYYQSLVD